jgi:hypothetical protein
LGEKIYYCTPKIIIQEKEKNIIKIIYGNNSEHAALWIDEARMYMVKDDSYMIKEFEISKFTNIIELCLMLKKMREVHLYVKDDHSMSNLRSIKIFL